MEISKGDLVTSVPASAGSVDSVTSNSAVGIRVLAHEPNSHKSADKPEDSGQEGEGDVGLPPLTYAALSDVAPVEDATAV